MRLTRPTHSPGRAGSLRRNPRALTTEPGFRNPNRQTVERATGARSATRSGQTLYALRCGECGFLYGCNGLDIKERRCPQCQGGVPGEPIPEAPPTLFG